MRIKDIYMSKVADHIWSTVDVLYLDQGLWYFLQPKMTLQGHYCPSNHKLNTEYHNYGQINIKDQLVLYPNNKTRGLKVDPRKKKKF